MITILFTDVVGSTEISSTIGDVAADELRRLHFEDLNEAIAAANGTLVKTIGDAVMATYAGAADALHCAVEMQRAVARRNRRAAGQDLHIRIGISAGDATFEDGDWFGTPVIEAARLCSAAATDQILISDLVAALAGSRAMHVVNRLGQRELKGLPTPIDVSEVEWHDDDAAQSGVPLPGFVDVNPAFAFAGRAAELDTVNMAWKDAVEQRRRLVLISGEPGVGKTRLVTEFVRTAHRDGGIVLWGRCDEELEVPYQPFAEALRLYIASMPDDLLRSEFGPLAAELTLIVPDLVKRIPGASVVPFGDADAERHRLFEAVADAFGAIAQSAPVVLVLDDVHWSDKPSLLLLRHLLRRSQPIRLLILGTYRDTDLDRSHPLADVLADLRREQGVERLDLGGLDVGEITSFMELAAGHELTADGLQLAEAVHRETEGNPFFLSEMIRHLAESGSIVQRNGRWVTDQTLERIGIPEGIREVVGRRLSALSSSVNVALSVAAVIGPEFDISTIEAAGGPSGDELFEALDEAVGASVVREVVGAYGRYAFAHALVRSTLYDELSINRRVRLHWKVGMALVARYGEGSDRVDQIAHHLGEGALAGDPNLAVEYCVRAAQRATEDLAFEAATRAYDRALSVLELIDEIDLARRLEIELARIETLRNAGDDDFRPSCLRAVETARQLGDPVALALAAASMDQNTGQSDEVRLAVVREALAALDDAPSALRARLLMMEAGDLYWTPLVDERLAAARRALDMAREVGDTASLSFVLARAWSLFDARQPTVVEIAGAANEVLALAEPGTAPHMHALEHLCAMAAASGDTTEALAYLERLRNDAAETRLSGLIWRSMVASTMLAVHVGDLDRAETEAAAALHYAQEHGIAGAAMGAYGGVIYNVRRAQGRSGELIALLEQMVESQPYLPVWRVALAGAGYFAGRTDVVREQFDWLVADEFARIPLDAEYPVTLCGLARLAPSVKPATEVCRFLYEALSPFAGIMNYTGGSIADASDIGLACVAAELGWTEVADGHYGDAIALADGAGAVPYGLHYRYEWARSLVGRGDIDRARPLLEVIAERSEGRGMDGPNGYVAWSAALLASLD